VLAQRIANVEVLAGTLDLHCMHAPLLFDMSLSKHDDIFNLDCFAATCLSPYCLRIFPDMGWHRRCGRKL
jgi:hypothetical protein